MKIKSLLVLMVIALSGGACSAKKSVESALDSLGDGSVQNTKLDKSQYEMVSDDLNLVDLPSDAFLYFNEDFMVKSSADYSGFGIGVFVFDGQHISNDQLQVTNNVCVLIPANSFKASIANDQVYQMTNIVQKKSMTGSSGNFEGVEISLMSSIYSQILVGGSKVKDLTQNCFAGKLQILKPKTN